VLWVRINGRQTRYALFARAGHEVVFSYSKEKLDGLARDAGSNARAGTPKEAGQGADGLLLAVHWSRIDDVLNQAGDLAGKVILSCPLPLNAANTELVLGHMTSGAEALAKKVPGAEVVSAFNNFPSEVLLGVFEARGKATPPSMVYCGDTQVGKDIAATLIRDLVSTRSMPDPSRTRATPSRSRCSLPTSRMEEPEAPNWPTVSNGLG
jgi:predicted dinucleotide-binding enzyme